MLVLGLRWHCWVLGEIWLGGVIWGHIWVHPAKGLTVTGPLGRVESNALCFQSLNPSSCPSTAHILILLALRHTHAWVGAGGRSLTARHLGPPPRIDLKIGSRDACWSRTARIRRVLPSHRASRPLILARCARAVRTPRRALVA